MKYLLFLFVFGLFGLVSCKSTQLPPEKYDKASLTFGSGGGFTGAYHEYILLDDGRLYSRNIGGSAPTFLKNVDKMATKQFFDNIKTFGLDKFNYNEPQNLYYFLNYKSQKDSSGITWSGYPEGKIAIANSIYRLLIDQTQIKK